MKEWWSAWQILHVSELQSVLGQNLVLLGSLLPSHRSAASSSGMGEDPGSSLVGLKREDSTMSSPLMVIMGAMHCWSSLIAPQGMPSLDPEASKHAWGVRASSRRQEIFKAGDEGKTSHHPEAFCWAIGGLKAATCYSVKCWPCRLVYSFCTIIAPMQLLPLTLISFHQREKGLVGQVSLSAIHCHGYFMGSSLSLLGLT